MRNQAFVYRVRRVFDLAANSSLPYLLTAPYAELHSKLGLFYGRMAPWDWCELISPCPKCSRRSLEELEELLAVHVPVCKSLNRSQRMCRLSFLELIDGYWLAITIIQQCRSPIEDETQPDQVLKLEGGERISKQ
ncbi:hypothetical protein M433DRAFT_132962 [Acidomyces richmondensis BFW]|nr:hypothetical protein M433DRAFT_132962 [Acidomyces richmondensis BFW]